MFSFGDGFDCYVAFADLAAGYWDSSGGGSVVTFLPGRFSGSQAIQGGSSASWIKSSGQNDAVHHFVLGFQQTAAISGTNKGVYLQLSDGATAQCTVVFRTDGAVLLTSGGPTGTTIATYTGVFPTQNVWYGLEFEIIISNTVGRMRVRRNGNIADDFDSGAVLNTQLSANAYANRLQFGQSSPGQAQNVDDLFWRSDPTSVAWMGDIRCITRAPASDASVQFSRTSPVGQVFFGSTSPSAMSPTLNAAKYIPFTSTISGTVSAVSFVQWTSTPATGNTKCAIFATNPGTPPLPAAVLATATAPINTSTIGAGGLITFTFSPPLAVTAGTTYAVGMDSDNNNGFFTGLSVTNSCTFDSTSYAAFPVSNPGGLSVTAGAIRTMVVITPTANYMAVNEPQQDGTQSYVYDSVPGHSDLYGITPISVVGPITIAVTTRGYVQKSDIGNRQVAVQLKSGGTTVASPTLALSTGFQWVYRTDSTDPATGVAWTAAAVASAQIGPTIIS